MTLKDLIGRLNRIANADDLEVNFQGRVIDRVQLVGPEQSTGKYWVTLAPSSTAVGRTISDRRELQRIIGCENRIQTRSG